MTFTKMYKWLETNKLIAFSIIGMISSISAVYLIDLPSLQANGVLRFLFHKPEFVGVIIPDNLFYGYTATLMVLTLFYTLASGLCLEARDKKLKLTEYYFKQLSRIVESLIRDRIMSINNIRGMEDTIGQELNGENNISIKLEDLMSNTPFHVLAVDKCKFENWHKQSIEEIVRYEKVMQKYNITEKDCIIKEVRERLEHARQFATKYFVYMQSIEKINCMLAISVFLCISLLFVNITSGLFVIVSMLIPVCTFLEVQNLYSEGVKILNMPKPERYDGNW